MITPKMASLGMYDGGELARANDALWDAIAARLVEFGVPGVPGRLERTEPLESIWGSDRLLFGQTCGYPFAAIHHDDLRLIAAPRYSAPGCTREGHRSFVVVGARSSFGDLPSLRGAVAAINDEASMTGRHLLGDAVASAGGGRGFFASVVVTGSHEASLGKVASGDADVAAIDCVSYAHLVRRSPEHAAATRVLARTSVSPPLPFVISRAFGEVIARLVSRALDEALVDRRTRDARRALLLEGVAHPRAETYDRTLAIAARADRVFGAASAHAPQHENENESRVLAR